MKKKILIVIDIFLVIIIAKLLSNMVINNVLIDKYSKANYSKKEVKALQFANFIQNYVAFYNYGNIYYQNGEYENAIKEYKKALDTAIPKKKECDVRVNYTLAICKTVQLNEKEQESIEETIEKYETAIDVLTENGCANKNDSYGHSENAEKLKSDIQKEINRLKKLQKNNNKDNKEDDKDEDNNKNQDKKDDIEVKMQEIKEDAVKEQRKTESLYDSIENSNKSHDREEINKRW